VCIGAGAMAPAVIRPESARRGEGDVCVFGGQVGGVGAVRVRLEAGGDGGRADEGRERRLEIGGDGRLMETRRRGHGSKRMVLHVHKYGWCWAMR
jgi:hypothetical protein